MMYRDRAERTLLILTKHSFVEDWVDGSWEGGLKTIVARGELVFWVNDIWKRANQTLLISAAYLFFEKYTAKITGLY